MEWARANQYLFYPRFGLVYWRHPDTGPASSVAQDTFPNIWRGLLACQHESHLNGALIVVDERRSRVRICR
jgi:hypothetical protein